MFRERAQLIQSYDVGSGGRFRLQELALGALLKFPNGMGPFEFSRVHGLQQHNVYLQAFLVYGWAGGMAYVTLLFATVWTALRTVFVRTPWQPYLICAFAAFVGEVLEGFVIDTDHWRHFFLLLGMIWGLGAATLNYRRAQSNAAAGQGVFPCRRLKPCPANARRCGAAPCAGCGSACRRIRARQILFDVSRMLAPQPDANPRGGFPLAIAGLFSTASGVGEGARLAYASLEAAGYAPAAFDLSPAFGQVELSEPAPRRALGAGAGSLIVHHNGPYLPHALWALGRSRVHGRRIIGYWAWELPRLPGNWHDSFRYLHEIWVPSTFTRDAVAAATDKPVHVVPHPLPPMPVTPNMRGKLGLPPDALIVLNVFHLGSAFSRKNPLAAIAAFRKAFGDAPTACWRSS